VGPRVGLDVMGGEKSVFPGRNGTSVNLACMLGVSRSSDGYPYFLYMKSEFKSRFGTQL